jgi:hypothetical protein
MGYFFETFQSDEQKDENEIEQQMANRADHPCFRGGNFNPVRGSAHNQSSKRAHLLGDRLEPSARSVFPSA